MRFSLSRSVLAVAIVVVVVSSILAAPSVPLTMSYQGRLTDLSGQPVADGSYSCVLSLWADSTRGTLLWTSGKIEIFTVGGVFSVVLGQPPMTPLDPSIFASPDRWLGIAVESQTEMMPRTKLTSVPYAFKAEQANTATTAPGYLPLTGGTMTGPTLHNGVTSQWQSGGTDRVVVDPINRRIQMNGSDGDVKATLGEQLGAGVLALLDSSPYTQGGALLAACRLGGGSGGTLGLLDSTGTLNMLLDAGGQGNSSVALPDSAIDSREILDEPGIAAAQSTATTALSCAVYTDLLTVSITIPAPGYIVVDARCWGEISSSVDGEVGGYVAIDEAAGAAPSAPYWTFFGQGLASGGGYIVRFPISTYRIYFKNSAGTYTFHLNASKFGNCQAPFIASVRDYMMKATYYPTSYGSVATFVSSNEASQFDKAEAVSVPAGPDGKGPSTTMYQVDLRELELKAAKLRADAEKAERELAEAKMNEMRKQQVHNASDKP